MTTPGAPVAGPTNPPANCSAPHYRVLQHYGTHNENSIQPILKAFADLLPNCAYCARLGVSTFH
eukprot:COSAG02_NODE_855_length_16487_cov_19.113498_4_plen_64_part_00